MVSDERPRAGESAGEVASRRRAKAQRLEKTAEAFERGQQGEVETAAALSELDPARWTVLHDMPWPGRKYANIDHVVVGPNGVYVIDSKNWTGRLSASGGVLRQNGYSRQRTVDGALAAASVVAGLVPELDRRLVFPVLCFAGGNVPVGELPDIVVVGTADLVGALTLRSDRLSAADVSEISVRLDLGLTRRSAPVAAPTAVQSAPRARRHRAAVPSRRPLLVKVASAGAVVAGLSVLSPYVLHR